MTIASNNYLEKDAQIALSMLELPIGLGMAGLDFAQMVLDIVKNDPFNYFQKLLFSQICPKVNLWPYPC